MATNKFSNKEHHAVVAIMNTVIDGEKHVLGDFAIEGYNEESTRRTLNDGAYFGALRKCVDRSGRPTNEVIITDLGREWWAKNADTSKQRKWWEEWITYPDYWDLFDNPQLEHLLDAKELAECQRIQKIIQRKHWEEERAATRARERDNLPELYRDWLQQEANGTIEPIDQLALDTRREREQNEYEFPPKPAHARTYDYAGKEDFTVVDVTDIPNYERIVFDD